MSFNNLIKPKGRGRTPRAVDLARAQKEQDNKLESAVTNDVNNVDVTVPRICIFESTTRLADKLELELTMQYMSRTGGGRTRIQSLQFVEWSYIDCVRKQYRNKLTSQLAREKQPNERKREVRIREAQLEFNIARFSQRITEEVKTRVETQSHHRRRWSPYLLTFAPEQQPEIRNSF